MVNRASSSRPRAAHPRRSSARAALLLLALAFAAPGGAAAHEDSHTGALDARDAQGRSLGACPLEHTELRAEISGFVVRAVVVQRFSNPFPQPIEAVYTFPLPSEGAVDQMWLRSGERRIRGEIARREDARQIYEQARQNGQLAALLDEERPNVFTQAIANLAPGAAIEIEIHYVAPLVFSDGAFEMAFPTVVGPRFVPGAPIGASGSGRLPDTDEVPDASLLSPPVAGPGRRAGHDLSIRVDLDAGVPIEGIESPLHAIDVTREGESRARVVLREGSALPDRDFVLRYRVAGEALRSGWLAHRGASGDGYVSVLLVPPRRGAPVRPAPRELIFVVDRSGSQQGAPLAKAQETLLWMLDHMESSDSFQIVSFSNQVEQLFESPQRPTRENVRRARRYVESLEADGGTWMGPAVEKICALPADPGRLRIVSFMTDGYVGNDLEVLELVRRLRGNSRWFPFGTGNSVNRFLIDGMAQLGGGQAEYVLLDEPGERVASKFAQRIAAPLLTDVRIEAQGVELQDVYPAQPSDVWAERPLLLHARYREPGKGRIVLSGFQGGEPYRQVLELELPARRDSDAAIASMWARARVNALLEQDLGGLQSGEFAEPLREAVIQVALEHRLLTPFTSFVAVDEAGPRGGLSAATIPVPVELPQGVSRSALGGEGAGVVRMRGLQRQGLRAAAAAQFTAPRAAAVGELSGALAAPAPASGAPPVAAAEPPRTSEKSESDRALRDEAREPEAAHSTDAAPRADGDSAPLAANTAGAAPARGAPLRVDYRLFAKLGPRLQALARSASSGALAPLDAGGRLRLALTLASADRAALDALAALGFQLESRDGRALVGALAPEQLGALLRLAAVRRAELADAPPAPQR